MPKVTIIRDDNKVGVDGVFRTVDLSGIPANIHAIQWDGADGFVEYRDSKQAVPLKSIGAYLSILDAYALAAPPAPTEPTDEELAESEVARLRFIAMAEMEDRRIETSLIAEAAKLNGAASAKAYIAAKGELADIKGGKP